MGGCPPELPLLMKNARPLPPGVEIALAELKMMARPLPPAMEKVLAELLQTRPLGLSDM